MKLNVVEILITDDAFQQTVMKDIESIEVDIVFYTDTTQNVTIHVITSI